MKHSAASPLIVDDAGEGDIESEKLLENCSEKEETAKEESNISSVVKRRPKKPQAEHRALPAGWEQHQDNGNDGKEQEFSTLIIFYDRCDHVYIVIWLSSKLRLLVV